MSSLVRNPSNLDLVNHFTRLSQLYFSKGQKNKGGTFSRVASLIAEQEEVVGLSFDLTQFPRVGSSSQREKDQFLETGSSERLIELLSDPNAPVETLRDKLTRLLTISKDHAYTQRVKSNILLVFAMNSIKTVDDALKNVSRFESFYQSDLQSVLEDLKNKGES